MSVPAHAEPQDGLDGTSLQEVVYAGGSDGMGVGTVIGSLTAACGTVGTALESGTVHPAIAAAATTICIEKEWVLIQFTTTPTAS